jgi:hypothetical protein
MKKGFRLLVKPIRFLAWKNQWLEEEVPIVDDKIYQKWKLSWAPSLFNNTSM